MRLFAHPFSSYCQKALVALYENGIAFDSACSAGSIRRMGRSSGSFGR